MNEIDKKFIDVYKEIGQGQGQDGLLLTIFAKLYIEPEEVAMDDLAKETGYSLASISNKIKMLGSMWPIKKNRKPGSKKIFLYIEKDFIKIMRDVLFKKEQYGIRVVKEKLPIIINEYKNKVKSDKDKKKVKILEDYYKQIIKCEAVIHEMIKKFDNLEKAKWQKI